MTAQDFAEALKAGRAYVSYGPLIFPSVMFGTHMQVRSGEPFTLAFDLASVAGVSRAELISAATVADSRSFPDTPLKTHVDFTLTTDHPGWYALDVEDQQGRKAYTDPVWVTIAPPRQ